MRVPRQRGIEARQLLVHHRVIGDVLGELRQLARIRQLAEQQQKSDLKVGRLLRGLIDRGAAVEQNALVAVDIGDCRAAARGAAEAWIERTISGLVEELTDVDNIETERPF